MNIQISGNLAGPTVIFVAGWPDTCDVFRDNIMAALEEDYRIVGITLPGFDAEAPFITSYKDYMRRLMQDGAQMSESARPDTTRGALQQITRWCSPLAWLPRMGAARHSATNDDDRKNKNSAMSGQAKETLRLTPLAAAAMREDGGALYHTPFFGHNFNDLVTLLEIAVDTAMEMHNYCPRAILASSLVEGGRPAAAATTTTTTVQGVPVHQLPPFYPRPVLVAHDWGCKLAFDLLQARPDFFSRLVALDIGKFWTVRETASAVPRLLPAAATDTTTTQQPQEQPARTTRDSASAAKAPSFVRHILGMISYQLLIIVCFLAVPMRVARWLLEGFAAIAGRPVYQHNPDIRLDPASESFNRKLYRQRFYSQHYYHGGHEATVGGPNTAASNKNSTETDDNNSSSNNNRTAANRTQEEATMSAGGDLLDVAVHDAGVDLSSAPMAGWSILLVPFIRQGGSYRAQREGAAQCPVHGVSQTSATAPRGTSWWRFWSSAPSQGAPEGSTATNVIWHGYAKAGRRQPGPMLHADPYHALQDSTVFCSYDARHADRVAEGKGGNSNNNDVEYGDGGDVAGSHDAAAPRTQAGGCTCGAAARQDDGSHAAAAAAESAVAGGNVRFAKREVYYRSFFFPPREDRARREGNRSSEAPCDKGSASANRTGASTLQRRRTTAQTASTAATRPSEEAASRGASATGAAAARVRVNPRTGWIYVRFWVSTLLWLLFAPRPSSSSTGGISEAAGREGRTATGDAVHVGEEQLAMAADSAQASVTAIPIAHHYDVADTNTHSTAARWAGASAAVAVAVPRTREEAVWQSWLDNAPPRTSGVVGAAHAPASSSAWRRYCTTLPARPQEAVPVPILFMYGGAKRLQFHSPAWCDYIVNEKRAEDGISDAVEVKGGGHWFYAEKAHSAAVAGRVREFIAAEAMPPSHTGSASHAAADVHA